VNNKVIFRTRRPVLTGGRIIPLSEKEQSMADKDKEITSYNKELMSFDFDDMSVEGLEDRLELAIAFVMQDIELDRKCTNNSCETLTCGRSGYYCDGFLCGVF